MENKFQVLEDSSIFKFVGVRRLLSQCLTEPVVTFVASTVFAEWNNLKVSGTRIAPNEYVRTV